MKNRAQKIRLGIFIATGAAIIIFLMVFFTARQLLERKDTYFISFQDISVSGMEVGSPVRYLGIRVGSISDIQINPVDITSIIVELSLKPGTPVKEDSKADIVTMGITGLKSIEIRGGTNESAFLKPGGFIEPGTSLADEITGKAEVIAEKAEQVLNNLLRLTSQQNIDKITGMVDDYTRLANNTDRTILSLDTIIRENRANIRSTVDAANQVTENLIASTNLIQKTVEQINTYATGDSISEIIGNLREITHAINESNIKQLIEDLAILAQHTQQLLIKVDDDINKGSQYLVESQSLLKSTLRNLDEASRKINRDPSLLIRGSRTKDSPDDLLRD
ncbi:MlaD family protein [Alkalitalea saponilacus]|uniref:MlaD protein n=1 Tax=Alkalitalea saponilacus TaxID=889453 RepID=A0A1T5HGR4_9BACT|nr:MlaD family protein [Alkalitalea saponilacus]ASB48124.1 mammalian cell entry protein [Alkalitalea saponilacus]SKC19864.1 MlaD protein [Alkalitalea saponilacus]